VRQAAAGAMNLTTAAYAQRVVHDASDKALNLLKPAMCANFYRHSYVALNAAFHTGNVDGDNVSQ